MVHINSASEKNKNFTSTTFTALREEHMALIQDKAKEKNIKLNLPDMIIASLVLEKLITLFRFYRQSDEEFRKRRKSFIEKSRADFLTKRIIEDPALEYLFANDWIANSAKDFVEDFYGPDTEANRKVIRKALDLLCTLEFCAKRFNPYEQYNRNYQYQPLLANIHKGLNKLGYSLMHFKVNVPNSKMEFDAHHPDQENHNINLTKNEEVDLSDCFVSNPNLGFDLPNPDLSSPKLEFVIGNNRNNRNKIERESNESELYEEEISSNEKALSLSDGFEKVIEEIKSKVSNPEMVQVSVDRFFEKKPKSDQTPTGLKIWLSAEKLLKWLKEIPLDCNRKLLQCEMTSDPSPTSDPDEIALKEALKQEFSVDQYQNWISKIRLVEKTPTAWKFETRSGLVANWVMTNMYNVLLDIIRRISPSVEAVIIK